VKKVLLDTNSYSLLLRGDQKVEREISSADTVFISVITLGELMYGFYDGGLLDKNLKLLAKFLKKSSVVVLKVNKKTSFIYGKIKFALRKKGTPIPENDIWIASQSVETDSVLITYDKHFLQIKGIKLYPISQESL